MKLIDPATGQAVWDSNDPNAGPVPPAPEGRQWVRVDEPGDTMAPRRTAPGILDIGNGVTERLAFLNQTFNPVEGIGSAMRAGSRMVAPDQSYWDRIASLGEMASGVASIAAPIAAAKAIGVPAASAMMEGLLGFSPARQAAGDMATQFARSESGALPGMGRGRPSLDVSRRDASNIFGEGSERVRYTDPQSGGTIEVVVRPDGSASVLELEVPEASRGQGIGQTLQERVMQDFPMMGGQVSSKAAATTAYRLGRRPPGKPDATLEEVFADIDEMSSVNMVSPAMQERLAPARSSVQDIEGTLQAKYPDIKLSISGSPERGYTLNKIDVPKGKRESGIGTAVMNDLVNLADQQGAVLKLSPSGDFGGSVPRLKDFYARFGFVQNKGRNADYAISESMYRVPSVQPLTQAADATAERGAQVMDLLRSGRAADVTDAMLDMGDPALNARLNEYLYRNYDLPMDYESRMGRAKGMGFDPALHGTGADISAVDTSFFGSGKDALGSGFYTTTNANRANVYAPKARSPSIEVSKEFAEGANVMPLSVRMDAPFDLAQQTGAASGEIGRAASVDPYYTHDPRLSGDFISGQGGESAFLDPYHPRFQTLQRLRAGFGPQTTSDFLSEAGYSGVVGPEAGGNLVRVSYRPEDIRSRFARFDPRLSHLRNLSAGVGGAAVLTALGDDAEAGTPETQIMDLVKQSGVSGAAQILGVSRRDIEEAISIAVPPSQWDQLVVGPQ